MVGRCCSGLSAAAPELALEVGELGADGTALLVQLAPLGVGNRAGGVLGLDAVIHERIQQELLAHVLEVVLLSPSLEHAVGKLDVA
jgi:ABC-type antimicrobial peptide transport system permease subunit